MPLPLFAVGHNDDNHLKVVLIKALLELVDGGAVWDVFTVPDTYQSIQRAK